MIGHGQRVWITAPILVLVFGGMFSPAAHAQQEAQAVDPGLRWVTGQVVDWAGNAMGHTLVRVFNRDSTDSTFADASGRFILATTIQNLTAESLSVQGMSKVMAASRQGLVSVPAGDTLDVLLDARLGSCLNVTRVISEPEGIPDQPLYLSPGQGLEVVIDFHLWIHWHVPQADIHLVAGIERTPGDLHAIGTPGTYPGMSGRAAFRLTAPVEPGRYRIFLGRISKTDTSKDVLFGFYRTLADRNLENELIPVGTIIVR